MGAELDFREMQDRVAFEVGPFRVTPFLVNHPVEAYGLRVEAGGRTLAYTGDTDSCEALSPLCRDATLVLADSAFVDGRDAVEGIHLSGSRAARAAVRGRGSPAADAHPPAAVERPRGLPGPGRRGLARRGRAGRSRRDLPAVALRPAPVGTT